MSKLSGKTALVTGASGGIGRAIAERLAADGALVAVHYGRNEAAASKTAAAINRAGGRAFIVGAEFGVTGDVDTLFAGLTAGLVSPVRPTCHAGLPARLPGRTVSWSGADALLAASPDAAPVRTAMNWLTPSRAQRWPGCSGPPGRRPGPLA